MSGNLKLLVLITAVFFMFVYSDPVLGLEKSIITAEKYNFTSDWFTYNIPNWTRILHDMKGKPGLTYLEIGPYEGRSFLWVMDNILTHPSSKAIAIDTFDKFYNQDPEKTFLENLQRSGHRSQITVIKGSSQQKLRNLQLNSIDLIYIDGDHRSKSVLMDVLLAWDLLKDGGILILDDYKWDENLSMEMRPEFAIDIFQNVFPDEFQILLKDYQLIVRKTKFQCIEAMGFVKRLEVRQACSRLGPYIYYWKPQKLYEMSTYREVILSKEEISVIENTLHNRKFGFRVEAKKNELDLYTKVLKRLDLQDISVSSKDSQ